MIGFGTRDGAYRMAWAYYVCALQGHVWAWLAHNTNEEPPKGCMCARCGAVNK